MMTVGICPRLSRAGLAGGVLFALATVVEAPRSIKKKTTRNDMRRIQVNLVNNRFHVSPNLCGGFGCQDYWLVHLRTRIRASDTDWICFTGEKKTPLGVKSAAKVEKMVVCLYNLKAYFCQNVENFSAGRRGKHRLNN